jgi:hypothetical protein
MSVRGVALPESNYVIRYISPRYIHDGVVDTNGFLRRPNEIASSVNWLECETLEIIRQNTPLKYHKNGLLVQIIALSTYIGAIMQQILSLNL